MKEGQNFKNVLMKQGLFQKPQRHIPISHYRGVPPTPKFKAKIGGDSDPFGGQIFIFKNSTHAFRNLRYFWCQKRLHTTNKHPVPT